jgi:hypothetical protein
MGYTNTSIWYDCISHMTVFLVFPNYDVGNWPYCIFISTNLIRLKFRLIVTLRKYIDNYDWAYNNHVIRAA